MSQVDKSFLAKSIRKYRSTRKLLQALKQNTNATIIRFSPLDRN